MAMTEDEAQEMRAARQEFENKDTTDERRKELVERLIEIATKDPYYDLTCHNCKKMVVYIEYGYGLCEGHVYSRDGIREMHISGLCEFCFDKDHSRTRRR